MNPSWIASFLVMDIKECPQLSLSPTKKDNREHMNLSSVAIELELCNENQSQKRSRSWMTIRKHKHQKDGQTAKVIPISLVLVHFGYDTVLPYKYTIISQLYMCHIHVHRDKIESVGQKDSGDQQSLCLLFAFCNFPCW